MLRTSSLFAAKAMPREETSHTAHNAQDLTEQSLLSDEPEKKYRGPVSYPGAPHF